MNDPTPRHPVHELFMQRAIELARHGWFSTRPNPRVGCVVTRDNVVCGEGWHERAGEAHAEVRALEDVRRNGHQTRGATAYVTLEPCSHHGRTPPCAEALLETGIGRVVVGARDPNPAVDGRGLEMLRNGGIEVVTDVAREECENLNPGFNKRMRTGIPRVRVKLAMSIDGRTTAADGTSRWITGKLAREDVHRLRAESGAVMTGRGTLDADDPSLTVRLPGEWAQPLRVVLDSQLTMTPQARMLTLPGETLVVTACKDESRQAVLRQAGAEVLVVGAAPSGLDLEQTLLALGQRGINDLLVEAGPTLAGALCQAGLVDEVVIYAAPLLIGDAGRSLMRLNEIETLADARQLSFESVELLGHDLRITARPINEEIAG